jgi:hypothetical protein
MEDDDAEMADHGTDDADDVDPNYDAEARPQQGSESTVEIRTRRPILLVTLRRAGRIGVLFYLLSPSRGRQMTAACSLYRTLNWSRMLPVRA